MPSGVRGGKSGGGGVQVLTGMEMCVLCQWLCRQPAHSSTLQAEPSCTTDTWLSVLVSHSLSCGQG